MSRHPKAGLVKARVLLAGAATRIGLDAGRLTVALLPSGGELHDRLATRKVGLDMLTNQLCDATDLRTCASIFATEADHGGQLAVSGGTHHTWHARGV